MKTLFTAFALLTLVGNASAQFTFKAVGGRILSSKKPADAKWSTKFDDGTEIRHETYFTWGKDHVNIQMVEWFEDGVRVASIDELIFYYDNFTDKTLRIQKDKDSFNYNFSFPAGKLMPWRTHYQTISTGKMRDFQSISFATKAEGDAFLAKMADKQLEMALDLDYVAPPKLVIAEGYEVIDSDNKSNDTPAPVKPSQPKLTRATVTLVNNSKSEVKLSFQNSPNANSSQDANLKPGEAYDIKIDIGGQVHTRGQKVRQLLLTITKEMHKTKQVIAK
jgi:hypothetical protein